MIIKNNIFKPVLVDTFKFIFDGKIPDEARLQFQKTQNLVADEVGFKYDKEAGLYELFEYCEENNIESESLESLFSALKYNNFNLKRLYGIE